ncbi:transcription initiation factor IIA, gamma subunit-domain-containing protein [Mycena olivaceomarginata]|nr:transcription initiation factor IIA, gamma subunit-domain-containing protein [Mycena olivaceomarginata]
MTASQGHLKTYRLCDDVWTFVIKQASLTTDQSGIVTTPRLKIIACKNGDATDGSKK